MGCCISKREDKTPLQIDQERFENIQEPDQPMRQITYKDKEGNTAVYWARHNEQLRTEGRSVFKRQRGVRLDVLRRDT
jgi:hypothetical protein